MALFKDLSREKQVEAYLSSLKKQLRDGLIDRDEYKTSVALLKPKAKVTARKTFTIEEASPDEELVKRLETLYYRELFGRKPSERDHKLHNEVLIGKDGLQAAGAIWYTLEPTPGYKNCVYLDMIFVGNEYRKTGLGTQLMFNLLSYTPEEHSIITYAWKPVIDFYRRHGFLSTDEESTKGGQLFLKMVLPLTQKSFDKYCREKANVGNYFDAYDELITEEDPIFNLDYLNLFVNSVANLTQEEERDFSLNPFTALLYHRAKQEHSLLAQRQGK